MSNAINHLHLGYFTLQFDPGGVTITHVSGRVFRINDAQAPNGPRFLQRYNALFHAMRNEEDIETIPDALAHL